MFDFLYLVPSAQGWGGYNQYGGYNRYGGGYNSSASSADDLLVYLGIAALVIVFTYFATRSMTKSGGRSITPFVLSLITGTMISTAIIGVIGTVVWSLLVAMLTFGNVGATTAALMVGIITTVSGAIIIPIFGVLGGFIGIAGSKRAIKRDYGVQLYDSASPVYQFVDKARKRLGIGMMPEVGHYRHNSINAFAAGSSPKDALVAFTDSALDSLQEPHINAIAAHELGHVANQDMKRMAFARGFRDAAFWFLIFRSIKGFFLWIFAWAAESAIMALSRAREYRADAVAAEIVGKQDMIGALEALRGNANVRPSMRDKRYKEMMISAFKSKGTHPTIDERVRALELETYRGSTAGLVVSEDAAKRIEDEIDIQKTPEEMAALGRWNSRTRWILYVLFGTPIIIDILLLYTGLARDLAVSPFFFDAIFGIGAYNSIGLSKFLAMLFGGTLMFDCLKNRVSIFVGWVGAIILSLVSILIHFEIHFTFLGIISGVIRGTIIGGIVYAIHHGLIFYKKRKMESNA